MIQKLRNPYWMKWGLWAIILLIVPAFVLFYGFGDMGATPQMSTGPLMTVHTDSGRVEYGPREYESARNEAAAYYAELAVAAGLISPFQQRSVQNQISGALRTQDITEFAMAQVALRQRLEDQGVRVTGQQVSRFLRDAGMTQEQLQNILRANRMTVHEYESIMRSQLQVDMARQSVSRVARTSLLELWQEYLLAKEELTFDYVRLAVRPDQTAELDEAEVLSRYEELVEDRDPTIIERERYVFDYVTIPLPPANPELPAEEELREAYEEIPEDDPEFVQEGGIEVRHLLIATGPGMTEEERAEARERAEAARARIEEGESFAAVANEVSEDIRNLDFADVQLQEGMEPVPNLRGGLLPNRLTGDEIDAWGEEWVRFINEEDEDVLSPVIETPQGFSVARVESRREAGRLSFEEARTILRSRLMEERREAAQTARDAAAGEAMRRMDEAVAVQTTLQGIANELGVEVERSSPVLTTSTSIPGVGNLANEREALRLLVEEGDMSPRLVTNTGQSAVLRLAEINPERVRDLDEVRATVENSLRREKAREAATARAEAIKERIEQGEALAAIAEEEELELFTIEDSPREDIPSQLGIFASLEQDLIQAREGSVVISRGGTGDFVTELLVAHVQAVEEPDMQTFMAELRDLERDLLSAKRQGYVEDFRKDAVAQLRVDLGEVLLTRERDARDREARARRGREPRE